MNQSLRVGIIILIVFRLINFFLRSRTYKIIKKQVKNIRIIIIMQIEHPVEDKALAEKIFQHISH